MLYNGTKIVSLDLGQVKDFSAVTVTEYREQNYIVRAGERLREDDCFQLTPYQRNGRSFYDALLLYLMSKFDGPMKRIDPSEAILVIDFTGPGREVARIWLKSQLSRMVKTYGVQIRAAETKNIQRDSGLIQVGRAQLLTQLSILTSAKRLQFDESLPILAELQHELVNARTKEPRFPSDGYRSNVKDDLVFSLAQGVFIAEKLRVQGQAGFIPVVWS